jgi:hypothetical protein
MTDKKQAEQAPAPAAEDILDRQYHAIGIGAVAAACRYIHDPAEPHADAEAHTEPHADDAKAH